MRFPRPSLPARQSATGTRVIADRRRASRGTRRAGPAMVLAAALCGGAMLAASAHADTAIAQQDATPPYSLTANVTLASQYRYRGLMQTDNKPAIQGGFDFTHESGFYIGNWNSNISWLSDSSSDVSAPVEMDFYGGYRGNFATDLPFDFGALKYYYPGDYPSGYTNPDTTELYGSVGYKTTSFKYSYAVSNLFGFAKSKGSQYFDLSGNYELGVWALTLNTHVGYQYARNVDKGSYYDWKLGLTKDMGQGLGISLAYIDTNADRDVYTNSQGRFMGRGTVVASITKTF
jgi:uncharacterized protein (TIGR02001 family)